MQCVIQKSAQACLFIIILVLYHQVGVLLCCMLSPCSLQWFPHLSHLIHPKCSNPVLLQFLMIMLSIKNYLICHWVDHRSRNTGLVLLSCTTNLPCYQDLTFLFYHLRLLHLLLPQNPPNHLSRTIFNNKKNNFVLLDYDLQSLLSPPSLKLFFTSIP